MPKIQPCHIDKSCMCLCPGLALQIMWVTQTHGEIDLHLFQLVAMEHHHHLGQWNTGSQWKTF